MEKVIQWKEYLYQFLTEERKAQFEKVLSERTRHFSVAVENIFQAQNSNAVLRSCDCFGIQDCHIIETFNQFKISPGASKGSYKWIDLHKYDNTKTALETLRNQGYQIVATTPHASNSALDEFDISKKSVFFFGAEKKGLSQEVLNTADVSLKIPMFGHTESLNISVSASIILQHVMQKLRRQDDVSWKISEEELEHIRLDWAIKSSKRIDMHVKNFEKTYGKL